MKKLAGAALAAILLAGCTGQGGPSATSIEALQAWARALTVAADAAITQAEADPTLSPAIKANLPTWETNLNTVSAAFVGVDPNNPGTQLPVLAAQLSNAAEVVVAGIPTIPANYKTAIELSLPIISAFAQNLVVPATPPPASLTRSLATR